MSTEIKRVVMLPLLASNGHIMDTTVDCDARCRCDDQVFGVWRGRTVEPNGRTVERSPPFILPCPVLCTYVRTLYRVQCTVHSMLDDF